MDTDVVGLQIHLQYLDGLFSWASEALDEDAIVRATEIGVLAILFASASEEIRSRLQDRLIRLLDTSRDTQIEARNA